MPVDDPNTWLQGATALKAAFDAFRAAIAGVKDIHAIAGGQRSRRRSLTKRSITRSEPLR
jgi:hypothetical protein